MKSKKEYKASLKFRFTNKIKKIHQSGRLTCQLQFEHKTSSKLNPSTSVVQNEIFHSLIFGETTKYSMKFRIRQNK